MEEKCISLRGEAPCELKRSDEDTKIRLVPCMPATFRYMWLEVRMFYLLYRNRKEEKGAILHISISLRAAAVSYGQSG